MAAMIRVGMAVVLVVVLAGCGRSDGARPEVSTAADSPPEWVLGAARLGKFDTGISLAQFNTQLGETLMPSYEISATCDHVDPASFPDGVIVMIENDSVVRFDVENPAIRTQDGAGVGDLEADVVRRYGDRIAVTPHAYTGPEGHYLTLTPPDDTLHRIIFETDGQRVLHIRAGQRPAVDYIEGCA